VPPSAQVQPSTALPHRHPVHVLVIQMGALARLIETVKAVYEAHPSALCVGWVRSEDLKQVTALKLFGHVEPIVARMELPQGYIPDLCVFSVEDRPWIRYWSLRNLPLRRDVQRIATYGRSRRLREFSRRRWRANTILVCLILYPLLLARAVLLRAWNPIRHYIDVAMLFTLAGLAYLLRGISKLFAKNSRMADGGIAAGGQRVILFIPSLGMGGAQRQLLSYLKHMDRSRWNPEVVTMKTLDSFFVAEFQSLGIPVTFFRWGCRFEHVGIVWQLISYLRRRPCAVLHSWLHYAVAIGAIAGGLVGVPLIVGSLRSERPGRFPWFYPRWQRAIDVLTGPLQTTVIANSRAVQEDNQRWAFLPNDKLVTIYNGIEINGFPFLDDREKAQLKMDLGLPPHESVVGIVGRLFPEKDHATFLSAAERVLHTMGNTIFLIVGDGSLRAWVEAEIKRRGLTDRVLVLGERRDAKQIMQILDVLVLTSVSEGLPNVLLEGAVSGVPTVTTAAGGAAEVVIDGETGYVVPCGDWKQVGDRIVALLQDPLLRKRFGEAATGRMSACFDPHTVARMIEGTYIPGDVTVFQEASFHQRGTTSV
jgi:glycosyltransferase involved in cell wall biosynthesis